MRHTTIFIEMKMYSELDAGSLAVDAKEIRDHGQWAIALAFAGIAIIVPATATGNKNAFLIALGMIIFAIGQMRNRQAQTAVGHNDFGQPAFTITGNIHRFTLIGTAMTIIGTALFGFGLYRFVFG